MDIIKIQQELLAEIPGNLRPPFYRQIGKKLTMLINSPGSIAYLVPSEYLYLDVKHLKPLDRIPFREYVPGAWTELIDTGTTLGVGKHTEKIYKRGGSKVYLDKNLLKHFDKKAKLYQEGDLQVVAVLEQGLVVAYVLPCRPPKEENPNT